MQILITGSSGFIGSHLVQEALRRGWQVWAGIRRSSSKDALQDERIHFITLDFSSPQQLRQQLLECRRELGNRGWDYVIHAAGVTKCLHHSDFYRTNLEGTRNLAEALQSADMKPHRFVFLSSLSVFGDIRQQPVRKATKEQPWVYSPILPTDKPHPNTTYGKSKLQAEQYLQGLTDFPLTILRPTGVYGPREHDYMLMAQSIEQHFDFSVGFKPQEITFVYVMDLVEAVFQSMQSPAALGKAYFLTDGKVYTSRRFSELLQQELGTRCVVRLKIPLFLLRIVCRISDMLSHLTGRITALNNDKYHILSQRNWQCDISDAQRDFGYQPQWPLERGVKATVQDYLYHTGERKASSM